MDSQRIEAALAILEDEVSSLQADIVDRGGATRLVALFSRGERICAAGTALLARRVDDASLVARTTGTSVGRARALIGLSERLRDTPALASAVRGAEVSLDQATEIAKAETAAPGSAEALVDVARHEAFHVLKERARAAALEVDRASLGARQRAARRASHRITDLGMIHIEADLEPHVGAPIIERIEAGARRLRAEVGQGEGWAAHLADAFAELWAGGSGRSARPELVVVVSHGVTQRNWSGVEDGEVCAIPGVGPIDPQVAKRIAQNAFLTGVFYDGTDLRHIRRWTRSIPVEVRLALSLGEPPEFDGARCTDCGNRWGLEVDHVVPMAAGGPTSLPNTMHRCGRCHRRKTADDRRAGAAAVREDRAPP
ncbi:MAG: HNH endonuclease signature motif containing protein [Acidimicrobiia bacterium]